MVVPLSVYRSPKFDSVWSPCTRPDTPALRRWAAAVCRALCGYAGPDVPLYAPVWDTACFTRVAPGPAGLVIPAALAGRPVYALKASLSASTYYGCYGPCFRLE